MSAVYNLEPAPTGKVVLHTTVGDILLELFAKQTPLTSRNFLQLCLDGYYDNTIFHRLVPGFVLQGGDPTGTGSGGQSSYDDGRPFEDEFHSRLKFNRRGLLGMANTGVKNDNGSQFFLTLGKTEELTGRNTMFGRIEGNTIYNLVKMGEAELTAEEGSERPIYPTRITGTEVIVNPFEDMMKRNIIAKPSKEAIPTKKKTTKKKMGKTLLSFGGEDGEDEAILPAKAVKFNSKLVAEGQADGMNLAHKRAATDVKTDPPKRRRISPSPEPEPILPPKPLPIPAPAPEQRLQVASRSPSPSTSPERDNSEHEARLERANAQIAQLKSAMKRNVNPISTEVTRKKSTLAAMIPATSSRGRRRKGFAGATGIPASSDEQRALDAFNAFRKKLDSTAAPSTIDSGRHVDDSTNDDDDKSSKKLDSEAIAPSILDEEAALCDLHFIANCQSCSRWDQDADPNNAGEDDNDASWLSHSLTFAKDRLGKDLEWKRQNEQELRVIDPLQKVRDIQEERKKGKPRERDVFRVDARTR